MSPEILLVLGVAVCIMGVVAALKPKSNLDELKRMADEALIRVEEAQKIAEEARKDADEAVANAEAAKSKARKELLEMLSAAAAVLSAMENVDDDSKFQLALTKLKDLGAPVGSLTEEHDLRTYLYILHAVMHNINEPERISRLDGRVNELEQAGLIRLSEEARNEVQGLIDALNPVNDEECAADYRQFVEILKRIVLQPAS
ncbi:MAG: hypothetical protein IAF58_14705 [Leptolyngbya sp.]|nr:hypothetical protein [Candidatus Melainabacteria bacterium]